MTPRIYLAGPDVFLPAALVRAAEQKRICQTLGLAAISPLDDLPDEPAAWASLPEPSRIARRNEAHIRGVHAILANLTPFRGPSADSGTIYEIGYARALGLPIFGYTCTTEEYASRVAAHPGATFHHDADGLAIERFGLAENLMIACAIPASGGMLTCLQTDPWTSLAAFARCAANAAEILVGNKISLL